MTAVTVRRDAKGVRALTVSGHAGYAGHGRDIVCAAASTLITTCANALESVAKIAPLVEQDEKNAAISVALPQNLTHAEEHDAQIIMETTLCGFSDIAREYPHYLQIY